MTLTELRDALNKILEHTPDAGDAEAILNTDDFHGPLAGVQLELEPTDDYPHGIWQVWLS